MAPGVHLTGETAIGARTPGAIAATFGAKATSKKAALNIKPSDATQKPAFERLLNGSKPGRARRVGGLSGPRGGKLLRTFVEAAEI